jgi:hypothetical protein
MPVNNQKGKNMSTKKNNMSINMSSNQRGKKYYPEFHRVFKGIIVEVCEGEGTEEDLARLVYYVYDEELKLLGRLDTCKSK